MVKCHLHLIFCTIHRYKKWFEDLLPKLCHLLCEPCTALIECASCVFLEGSLRRPIFSLEIFSLKIFISSLLASTAAPCEWAAKKVPRAATRSPGLQRQRRRRGVHTWQRLPLEVLTNVPECSRVPTYVEYSHRPPERLCIMNGSGAVCSDSSSSFFSPLFLILLFPWLNYQVDVTKEMCHVPIKRKCSTYSLQVSDCQFLVYPFCRLFTSGYVATLEG